MTKADQTKRINNSGIHSFLAIKRMRSEATYRICCDGSCVWIANGHQLTEQQFNEMYPPELVKTNVKGKRIGHPQQLY